MTVLAVGAVLWVARMPAMRGAVGLGALLLLGAHYVFAVAQQPSLYYRPSPLADRIVANSPALGHRFWPTPWCFNRHLQVALMMFRDGREPPLRFEQCERQRLGPGASGAALALRRRAVAARLRARHARPPRVVRRGRQPPRSRRSAAHHAPLQHARLDGRPPRAAPSHPCAAAVVAA